MECWNLVKRVRSCLFVPLLAVLSGCGVFEVPDRAIAAVNAWKEQTSESDPCRVNAMQHCVAASAVADQCGETCAVVLGALLELRQLDGDPMDFHNNRAGSRCAAPIGEASGGAIDCCEKLLNSDPPSLRTDGKCQ